MIVTYVMIVVCVVGVIGAIASIGAYDKPYGEVGGPMRIPRRSRKTQHSSRPSRQLEAVQAALEDADTDQSTACTPARSHRRWRRR